MEGTSRGEGVTTLPYASMKKLLKPSILRLTTTKLDELMVQRIHDLGYTGVDRSQPSAGERHALREIGRGVLEQGDFETLRTSKTCRGLNKHNVEVLANLLVRQGYMLDFPLAIGVMPLGGSPNSEYRVMLIGGAHRLAAVAAVMMEWPMALAGEEGTRLPWADSPFSARNPPRFLDELPVTVHYAGGTEGFVQTCLKMGKALNEVHDGALRTNFNDKIVFIKTAREDGACTQEILTFFPNDVKLNHKRKLLAVATALCDGRFPAVHLLSHYYDNHYQKQQPEVFSVDRFDSIPAKAARLPFLHGEFTKDTADKNFGMKAFTWLVIAFQRVKIEGRTPNLEDGLETRVATDGPLAKSCAPYSELMERTLSHIAIGVASNSFFQKMVGLVVHQLPGVPKNVKRAQDAWGVDLGFAVINKLLEDGAFIPPQGDERRRPFSAPEGDAWHDPVVSAVCTFLNNSEAAPEIKYILFGRPTEDKENIESEKAKSAEGGRGESDLGDKEESGLRDEEEHEEQDSTGHGGDSSSDSDQGSEDGRASSPVSNMDCSGEDPSGYDDEVKVGGCTTPGTLSFTGLSRFSADTLPGALKVDDVKSVQVHTVILHEEDPKLDKVLPLLENLSVGGCLHQTPVIIAVRSSGMPIVEGKVYESDDDDSTPIFGKRIVALSEKWEATLGKKSQRLAMRCPMSNTTLASKAYRRETPETSFRVDTKAVVERDVIVIVFHDSDTTPQMTISPMDPSRPWRKVNAGHLLLHGSDIMALVDSDTWKCGVDPEARKRAEERAEKAGRSTKGGGNTILGNAMSVEFYMSLLCRFHLEGTAVLSTWDPCGAEQAAACRLSRDSLCFLGLSTTATVESLDLDKVFLLGLSDGREQMQRVIADHVGGRKVSGASEQVDRRTSALGHSSGTATGTATGATLTSKGAYNKAKRQRVTGNK